MEIKIHVIFSMEIESLPKFFHGKREFLEIFMETRFSMENSGFMVSFETKGMLETHVCLKH